MYYQIVVIFLMSGLGQENIKNRQLTDSSKSRVRCVGGYCLKSVRKQYVNQITAAMYMKSSDGYQSISRHVKWLKF